MHTDTYVAKAHVVGFIMPNFLEKRKLSLGAKQLYALLCSFAGTKDHCWPSHKTLAARLSCSVSSIKNYLRQLTQHQLIKINHDSSRTMRSCIYYMLTPKEFQNSKPHSPQFIHTSHAPHATGTQHARHKLAANATGTTQNKPYPKHTTSYRDKGKIHSTHIPSQNLTGQNLTSQNLTGQNLAGGQANFGYNLNLNEFKKKPPIVPPSLPPLPKAQGTALVLAPMLTQTWEHGGGGEHTLHKKEALACQKNVVCQKTVACQDAVVCQKTVAQPEAVERSVTTSSSATPSSIGVPAEVFVGGVSCAEEAIKAERPQASTPLQAQSVAKHMPKKLEQPTSAQRADSYDRDACERDFEQFYALYPKKCGKENARKAWHTVRRQGLLPKQEQLLEAVRHAMACHRWQKDDGRYIPYPATYVRDRRWLDEVESGAHGHACGSVRPQESDKEKLIAQIAEQKVRERQEELRAIQAYSGDFECLRRCFAPCAGSHMASVRGLYVSLRRKGRAPQAHHVPDDAKDMDFGGWLRAFAQRADALPC